MAAALGVGAATLAFFGLVGAPPAPASPGTVTINPDSNVTPSSMVSVSATGLGSGGTFSGEVAISQCGNATTAGTPLTSPTASDCDGAGQVSHIVFATATNGSVPATSFTIRQSGIGANNDQCIPVTTTGQLPCGIAIGDVGTQGATVAATGTYTLAATTTTTTGSTTTTTGSTTTTTTGSTTTTTSGSTTTTAAEKTFTCDDIPLAASPITVTPNRCLTNGEAVAVSGPAGTFSASAVSAQATAFVLECNPDPSIPSFSSGGGCNLGGLQTPTINADGSFSTQVTVVLGTVGNSVCPPTSTQVASFVSSNQTTGSVTCVIGAAPGPSITGAKAAAITFQGETATLPSTFVPTTPSLSGGASGPSVGAAQATAATSPPPGGLAFTGIRLWWWLVLAAALLDLGYLLWSAVRPGRPKYADS